MRLYHTTTYPGGGLGPLASGRRQERAHSMPLVAPPEPINVRWSMVSKICAPYADLLGNAAGAGPGRVARRTAGATDHPRRRIASVDRTSAKSWTGNSMSLLGVASADSLPPCLPKWPKSSGARRSTASAPPVSPGTSGSAPGRRGPVSARPGSPYWTGLSHGREPISMTEIHMRNIEAPGRRAPRNRTGPLKSGHCPGRPPGG